jgi:hypothetical protein
MMGEEETGYPILDGKGNKIRVERELELWREVRTKTFSTPLIPNASIIFDS